MEESSSMIVDDVYEFSAPRFFDFLDGESTEDMRAAELWFDTALSYAPSPFMPKIKADRTVQLISLCDFSDAEQPQKDSIPSTAVSTNTMEGSPEKDQMRPQPLVKEGSQTETKEVNTIPEDDSVFDDATKTCVPKEMTHLKHNTRNVEPSSNEDKELSDIKEIRTPNVLGLSRKGDPSQTRSHKQTKKEIGSMVRNPSAPRPQHRSLLSNAKGTKPASARKNGILKNVLGTPIFTQENQAIKRQKLEGGRTRLILNVKPQALPHKLRPGFSSNSCNSTAKAQERKVYVREPVAPFVSTAEMMKRFQSGTRDISLDRSSSVCHDDASSTAQRKYKLTLTRPKEPEFITAQRARPVRIKSSDELEEEMMAKIPKFKARPLNKKILEAHLPPVPLRSTPHLPDFKEFHLETMARATKNAETSSVVSTETASQNHEWKPHLTAPKSPLLQTSLRARPMKVKTSDELEIEELEKAPKFKARPLNKKILESKGDLGLFCNMKRQVTIPQEFHFAVDERIPPPTNVADLFDKMSITSESRHEKLPRNTAPNPFTLRTEERGAEKEKKFVMEVVRKQIEEEMARIPKATPYPYTTDYPVVPPKPEPKSCTKPEPFQLESLTRHEEEMQREMEERQRLEIEEAQMRLFKAQPILKEDPIPVPEKVRKPLTEVQEFNLHVEHRAVDRAQFDKKIKEKEMMYKRYREEAESAKMMEEEKALKQLRRTLVPHARPVPNFSHSSLPQKCVKEVTRPKSPKLNVERRNERRRYVGAAASSAASRMR